MIHRRACAVLVATLPIMAMKVDADEKKLVIGQPFPTIYLPSLHDGKLQSVASFRQRKLMLHVFASW